MADGSKHVVEIDEEVAELLKKYPEIHTVKDTKKLKCSLTGHDMPCTAHAIKTYINGKKFKTLREKKQYSYYDHINYMAPSIKKFHEKQLYCFLTQTHVNDRPVDIQRLIDGRKYQRALREYKRCQETKEKFKPFGNLKRHRHDEDDEDSMSNMSDQIGEGGYLDSDHETDKKKNEEEDTFSDLYPEESDEEGKSGSDYDFDAMDGKRTGIKPKTLKTQNGKKNGTMIKKEVAKMKKKGSQAGIQKNLKKIGKTDLPQKKKIKRLKSSS